MGGLEAARMSNTERDTSYRGPDIPAQLGERLALALGLDDRPETFGDWVTAMSRIADRDDIEVSPDVLCTTEESPHRARIDGTTRHYQCVQDPIIAPFVADEVDHVEIETRSPVSEETIELTVSESGIEAEPSDAVFSFGVDATVENPPEDVVSPIIAYSLFCPYGHAFPSDDEYEAWAETVDAITMATSMEDTLELARAIGYVAR